MARRILVFGAEGVTGREVVRLALARGHPVRVSDLAFRAPEALPHGLEAVEADVLKGNLRPVVRGWTP